MIKDFLKVQRRSLALTGTFCALLLTMLLFCHPLKSAGDVFGAGHEIVLLLIGFGVLLFGFFLMRKKRLMEDIPFSKIRSVAMGLAEITGSASQKLPLKSPLTFTNCVYYRFRIEAERRRPKGGTYWETLNHGESANYFYVQDETGKILVDPLDAEVVLPYDYRYIDTVGRGTPEKRRYTEWYITPGEKVFVLGTAKKFKDVVLERKELLVDRLNQLKRDKEKLMSFDADKDGNISVEEWDQAVMKVKEEMLQEEINRPAQEPEDDIVIGKGETEDTLLISDRSEKELARRLAFQSGLCLISGFALIIGMSVSLLARLAFLPAHFKIAWEFIYR